MIFFDYDGVLVDSLWLWEEACKNAAKELGFSGEFPHKPYANLNPLAHKEIGSKLGLDLLLFERSADLYVLAHIDEITLFSDTEALLQELSQYDDLSVMSASHLSIVESSLQSLGVLKYFKALYCGSEVSKAQKLERYKDSTSVMIGDGISDMQAAKKAKVYGIGVLWGWQEAQMLQDADILVANHTELKNAIKDFYENHSAY